MPKRKLQMSRIDKILELAVDQNLLDTFGLVAAFCNCLAPQQACDLLVKSQESHIMLRGPLLRKVCNDIDQSYARCHDKLVQRLLVSFSQADARGRQGFGYCLSTLSQHIPSAECRAVQRVFLQSKYIGVRKRGYKSLSVEPEVSQNLVEDAWKQFHDPDCAWLIVKTFPAAYLIQHREALSAVFSEGWQLARLYLRIGEVDQDLLSELKSIDKISYCYVLAKLGLKLSAKEAKAFVDSCSGDERFGLLVWSFGRLGLWKVLQYVQAKLPAIHDQKFAALREKHGVYSRRRGEDL
jgi:hypothetical protein